MSYSIQSSEILETVKMVADQNFDVRTITIGMTDIGEIVFLPALLERLGREAPGVTLNTVRNNAAHLREDMEAGKVDLAIGLLIAACRNLCAGARVVR